MKKVLTLILALALTLPVFSAMPVLAREVEPQSFDILCEVQEWGQSVTAVIIDAGGEVTQAQVDNMTFDVSARTVRLNNLTEIYNGPRTVTAAYVSASKQRVAPAKRAASGKYIVVELKYGYNNTLPQVDGSAAHAYSSLTSAAAIAWPMELNYTVKVDGTDVAYGATIQPIVDDFELVDNPAAGFTAQKYRMYTPAGSQGKKLPLVLFNHGYGETYNSSSGRNNEGQTLVAQEAAVCWVTEAPEDCYVLVPQRSFSSYSRAGVVAFIKDLVAKGQVDPDRVYISGLSMGGAETISFMREFPDVFAGSITICPYGTSNTTAAQLDVCKQVPIWFVHDATDPVATPPNSRNLYDSLIGIGAKDARITTYPAVSTPIGDRSVFGEGLPNGEYKDESGNILSYYNNNHWSWIMAFNNLYVEDGGIAGSTGQGSTFMDWLFAQRREDRIEVVSVVANGDEYNKTTELTITLDKAVPGLSASNIEIKGDGVSAAGALSGAGPVYTLPVKVTKDAAEISVSLSKAGYWFANSVKDIPVFFVQDVKASLSANGSIKKTTTELTLTLDPTVDITAADITFEGNGVVEWNGKLTAKGGGSYTLPVTVDDQRCSKDEIEVAVTFLPKAGFKFIPKTAKATVFVRDVVEKTELSAAVEKRSGSKNGLTINLTETYTCGKTVDLTETFSISNNAAGVYEVGGYKVFVDTKGNDKIRALYIVE